MKRISLGILIALSASRAIAGTWQCAESTDGHVYIASQDVPGDNCQKVSNADPHPLSTPLDMAHVQTQSAAGPRRVRPKTMAQHQVSMDTYCVMIGKLTEDAARLRELGATEERVQQMNATVQAGDSSMPNNVVAYVYTTKPPSTSARLIGYKKCLAGDFN